MIPLFLLLALLPLADAADPSGRVLERQTYDADTLFEYIDGAAEAYLALDFQDLTVVEWKEGGRLRRVAEIYRMKDADRAFGMYARERPASGTLLPVGAEGYAEKGTLNFLSGPYYVKMFEQSPAEAGADTLRAWAARLVGEWGGGRDLPPRLACFPARGKVARSERFTARNFLGHPFLREAWSADYEVSGKRYTLALMPAVQNDGESALGAWVRKAGASVPEEDALPNRFTDPYQGEVAAKEGKGVLAAVIGDVPQDAAKPLLDALTACAVK